MHDIVGLRSDTLTLPTEAMRQAMARAEAGDVREEGPTMRRLEARAAARTGTVDLARVQTSIVIFRVARTNGAAELVTGALARKAKIHQVGPQAIRCVTHEDVDVEDIERALEAFREITSAW